MWLIAGLGNVGKEYEGTRHNIGFDVVDLLETKLERSSGWKAGKGDYYFAKGWIRGEEVVVIKPTTFMNLSGRAVRDTMQFYKIPIEQVLIISDDLAIELGVLRLRLRGSDGGHNGLGSITYELGTDNFARLRCGIGGDFRRGEQVKFVLAQFKTDERPKVRDMIEQAVTACQTVVAEGLEKAMNKVNPSIKSLRVKPVKAASSENSGRDGGSTSDDMTRDRAIRNPIS